MHLDEPFFFVPVTEPYPQIVYFSFHIGNRKIIVSIQDYVNKTIIYIVYASKTRTTISTTCLLDCSSDLRIQKEEKV